MIATIALELTVVNSNSSIEFHTLLLSYEYTELNASSSYSFHLHDFVDFSVLKTLFHKTKLFLINIPDLK